MICFYSMLLIMHFCQSKLWSICLLKAIFWVYFWHSPAIALLCRHWWIAERTNLAMAWNKLDFFIIWKTTEHHVFFSFHIHVDHIITHKIEIPFKYSLKDPWKEKTHNNYFDMHNQFNPWVLMHILTYIWPLHDGILLTSSNVWNFLPCTQ